MPSKSLNVAFLALSLLAPLLSGCLGQDDTTPAAVSAVAASAEEAGATSGPAPSAPKEAYLVAPDEASEEQVTAYPLSIRTNPAKPPVELDLSGEFKTADCAPGFDIDGVQDRRRFWDLSEHLAVGDVFEYDVTVSFTNTDDSWAEIHPFFAMGSTVKGHTEPVRDVREPIVINYTGQSYRASDEDMAFLELDCWWGLVTDPIAFTVLVKLTFAEAAVPAEHPIRVPVPEGATRLFVRGVALDPAKGVNSHYRVFGPDDRLVCECALGSNQQVSTLELDQAGDYVLLVDHTANGFVSLALDAPPEADAEAMEVEWARTHIHHSDGGPVDTSVEFELATVPLLMHVQAASGDFSSPSLGAGKKTGIVVNNARGEVMRVTYGGHLAGFVPVGDEWFNFWFGIWPDDWEYVVDHHAYGPGAHTAAIKAEAFRGDIFVITRQYVR